MPKSSVSDSKRSLNRELLGGVQQCLLDTSFSSKGTILYNQMII